MGAKFVSASVLLGFGLAFSLAGPAFAAASHTPAPQTPASSPATAPHVSAPVQIPRSKLPPQLRSLAATSASVNTAYADCPPGGPSESCTVYYIISQGAFFTAYYYEAAGGSPGILGPTGYTCPNTTCNYEQTGFPGSGGFSEEWEVTGNNATIYDIESHY